MIKYMGVQLSENTDMGVVMLLHETILSIQKDEEKEAAKRGSK